MIKASAFTQNADALVKIRFHGCRRMTTQPDHQNIIKQFMDGIPVIAGKNNSEIAVILAVAAANVDAYYDQSISWC